MIWLRTCYAPELSDAYDEIAKDMPDEFGYTQTVLDNESLYDCSWEEVLLRIPSLCDNDKYSILTEMPSSWEEEDWPAETHHSYPIHDAVYREVATVYLLDRQALEEKLVTVMWLDNFGECVWWYRVRPENAQVFNSKLMYRGLWHVLEMAAGEMEGRVDGVCGKGSVVGWAW
jgi:hypothetical protein